MYRCFDPNDPSFLVRRSEQTRVAQARAEEKARIAEAHAADEAVRATREREAIADRVAAGNCSADLRPSLCANEDATKARACLEACIAAVDQRQQAAAIDAESSCESRLSERKGPFTCGLVPPATVKKAIRPLPPETLLQFGRTPLLVEDLATFIEGGDSLLGRALNKVGGAGAALKFALALRDAKGPWDNPAVDAAFAQLIPDILQAREAVCMATCREHERAAQEAPGLVHAYKLCMVAADSAPQARRLQAYESTLYREFLEHADSKCRAGSRCDWLEGFSTARCTYDSP
jgi:hypothetical protein